MSLYTTSPGPSTTIWKTVESVKDSFILKEIYKRFWLFCQLTTLESIYRTNLVVDRILCMVQCVLVVRLLRNVTSFEKILS